MDNFILLSNSQINRLKIFEDKYSKISSATDFAILLGLKTYFPATLLYRPGGTWWSSDGTLVDDGLKVGPMYINNSYTFVFPPNWRCVGVRPAITYSAIANDSANKVRVSTGVLEVEYGEYPQYLVNDRLAKILENKYLNGTLNKTGKIYITDKINFDNNVIPFQPRSNIEYESNGRKFIRFESSNVYKVGLGMFDLLDKGIYWVEVMPVKWLVDEKANIAISKQIIFSGIQFYKEKNDSNCFENSEIKRFLDNCFAKDIIPSFLEHNSTINLEYLVKKASYSPSLDENSLKSIIREIELKQQEIEELKRKLIEAKAKIYEIEKQSNPEFVNTKLLVRLRRLIFK